MFALSFVASAQAAFNFTHHAIPAEWTTFFSTTGNGHNFYAMDNCENPIHALAYGGTDSIKQACANKGLVVTQVMTDGTNYCHFACTELKPDITGATPPVIDVTTELGESEMNDCQACIGAEPTNFLVESFNTSTFKCQGCAIYVPDYHSTEDILNYPEDGSWEIPITEECIEELVHMTGTDVECKTTTTTTTPATTEGGLSTASVASAMIAFVAALI